MNDFETQTFGDVTLVRGDCLAVMPTLPPASVAMVFADLPYVMTHHAYDVHVDIKEFSKSAERLLIKRAPVIMSAAGAFAFRLYDQMTQTYRYDLVWQKSRPTGFLTAKKLPMRAHEQLLVFCNTPTTYNPQMVDVGKPCGIRHNVEGTIIKTAPSSTLVYQKQVFSNLRHPTSIIAAASVANRKRLHPAQKPVALLEWLIRTYTNDGDTILDPVAGSGTTAIAAMNVGGGRKVICIERDPTYFEVMRKRIAEHQHKIEAKHG